jgi:hypothetical protein
MNNTSINPESGRFGAILQTSRAVMLMEPMAADFNDLLMVPPVRRVMIVAEVFVKASSNNDSLNAMVNSKNVFADLREEGRRRGNGDVVVPRAFESDFERVVAREGKHV